MHYAFGSNVFPGITIVETWGLLGRKYRWMCPPAEAMGPFNAGLNHRVDGGLAGRPSRGFPEPRDALAQRHLESRQAYIHVRRTVYVHAVNAVIVERTRDDRFHELRKLFFRATLTYSADGLSPTNFLQATLTAITGPRKAGLTFKINSKSVQSQHQLKVCGSMTRWLNRKERTHLQL